MKKDVQRPAKYKDHIGKLDYSGIKFPVELGQSGKIERQNVIDINVFGYEDKQPFPIYLLKESNNDVLNLLLITRGNRRHYLYIQNFNRFMFGQTNNSNGKHFCMQCLQCFSSERVLENYKEVCVVVNGKQAIKMPPADSVLEYKNFHKQLDVPFVIYADFEAITEKVEGPHRATESLTPAPTS